MRKIHVLVLMALVSFLPLLGVGNGQGGLVAHAQGKEDECDLKNAVLVGSSYGISCADDSGWNFYKTNGVLKTSGSSEIGVCPDGTLAFANFNGVSLFDGEKTSTLVKPPGSLGSKIACAGPDNIWVAGLTDTVYHFDGKAWETFKLKDFFKNDTSVFINSVKISPDGKTAWVTTFSSVGVYDGKDWTVYDKVNGLKNTYSLTGGIVFDSASNAWLGYSGGVLKFDGKKFTEFKQAKAYAKTLAIDSKDVLWVGTLSDGIFSFDGKKWTPYTRNKDKGLSSNRVNSIGIDGQDRVWVGTAWGVNVFDGKKWAIYQAANSDLKENNATSILTIGKGPKLPELAPKKPGKVTGKVIQGRDPIKNTTIELCSEGAPIASFTGKTPCGDYPDARSAKTDDNGEFEIDDVPVGRYGFVVQNAEKKWFTFFGINSSVVVKEDETTDLETITLKSS